MIKFNNADKPKAALLIGAVFVVFYVIVMRFNSLTAPKPQQGAVVELTASEGERAQTLFASNESTAVVLDMGEPVTSVNPFRKVLSDPNDRFNNPTPPPQSRPAPMSSFLPRASFAASSGADLPILPAQISSSDLREISTQPAFKLEGVLTGKDPVAVLSVGSASHVLGVGQSVAGYTIRSITDTTCKLQRGKETVILRLE